MSGRIVMVGTDRETRGGISEVVRRLEAAGFFQRWPVTYIASHRGGGFFAKLGAAAAGLGRLAHALVRDRQGVLHAHVASRASFYRKAIYMAAAMAAGWRVVFHLHGGGFARFYARGGRPTQRAIRFFLERSASVIVLSGRWARWVREHAPAANVECIPNPVAMPPPRETREPGALIAFTGRCVPGKGVRELVEAAARVVPMIPNLRLEMAGEGDLQDLERRAAAYGIRGHVHLHGWLPAAARDELLARADVFVLPSHAEGLPMSLLEAMAAGCAVIATPVGGIPDIVVDGVNGLLVPPRDPESLGRALLRLLSDPALARRLGEAARETVQSRFTAEQALARMESLYTRLGLSRAPGLSRRAATSIQEMA